MGQSPVRVVFRKANRINFEAASSDGKYSLVLMILRSLAFMLSKQIEVDAEKREPTKKARRWMLGFCQSWFNRFRKLLVRHEKLEQSFVAQPHRRHDHRASQSEVDGKQFTDNF